MTPFSMVLFFSRFTIHYLIWKIVATNDIMLLKQVFKLKVMYSLLLYNRYQYFEDVMVEILEFLIKSQGRALRQTKLIQVYANENHT